MYKVTVVINCDEYLLEPIEIEVPFNYQVGKELTAIVVEKKDEICS